MTDTERPARILLVEDNETDAGLIARVLRREGLDVELLVAASEAMVRASLAAFAPDVILVDLTIPGFSGAAAVALARAWDPSVPCILVSGSLGEELLIQALRIGATDYVPKQHLEALAPATRRALAEGTERRARVQAEAELQSSRSLLSALMDNVPDHVYFKDADSRFTLISRSMARSFGLEDPSEALGRTDTDFFPQDQAGLALTDERNVMASGTPLVDRAERETWPDGRETWASTTKMRYTDAEGRLLGTFGVSRDITRRVEAEAALRESEELYRAVTDALGEGILLHGLDRGIYACNKAAEAILGVTAAELIGPPRVDSDWRAIHEDGLPFAAPDQPAMVALDTGEPQLGVVLGVFGPTGDLTWLVVNSRPLIRRGETAPYAVVTSFADVTALREAQASLERGRAMRLALAAVDRRLLRLTRPADVAREVCRVIVETGQLAMAWVGLANPVTQQLEPIGSYGDTGYLGDVIVTADDSPLGRGPAGEAVRSGFPIVVDDIETGASMVPWREAAARYGYRSVAAFPVRHGEATRGVFVTYGARPGAFEPETVSVLSQLATDVALALTTIDEAAQRRAFEGVLAESERRFREVLVDVRLAAVIVDEAGAILFANRFLLDLTGWEAAEVLGRSWFEKFDPAADRTDALDGYFGLPAGSGAAPQRSPLVTRDGTVREIEWSSAPVRDEDGVVVGRASLGYDVTERAAAEAEIRRLNVELEQRVLERTAKLEAANRELETFSYSVSHDLRSPLRAITGFAEILDRRYREQLDAKGRHYLDNIVEGGRHMGVLIEELLEYSRLGRSQVHAEPVELGPILDRLRITLADRIAAGGGTLAVAAPLAVPAGDPVLVEQVLANLLDNAFVYRRPDVAPLVTVSAVRRGARVVVAVADNGLGIAPEFQARIFEPFVRLHTADEYPGTGIGLATVRKAARLMGSEVTLASVEGTGSTFSLDLPAAPAPGARR